MEAGPRETIPNTGIYVAVDQDDGLLRVIDEPHIKGNWFAVVKLRFIRSNNATHCAIQRGNYLRSKYRYVSPTEYSK